MKHFPLFKLRRWVIPCLTGVMTLAAAGALAMIFRFQAEPAPGLQISEVCPHNFSLAADQSGQYSDYIELRNAGTAPVDLSGYWLSDDPEIPDKFQLPELTLAPGGYVLVWADGTGYCEGEEIHANFRLSDGETLTLTARNRQTVDSVALDSMPDNVAATRLQGSFVPAYGTPGAENEGCVLYKAPTLTSPAFSLSSGFYPQDSINLEISIPAGATVYYTTDGSDPDTGSAVYEAPLTLTDPSGEPNRYVSQTTIVPDYDNHTPVTEPVAKANVIRAIAVDKHGNFSPVTTGTFFVGASAEAYAGGAVLSVISDPEGLFGDAGICVTGPAYDQWYQNTDRSAPAPTANFLQHGRQWEREAVIQLFDESGSLVLNQSCGMRVQGNSYRHFATKRFSFYARDLYSGSDLFNVPLFSGDVLSHSVYLRSDTPDFLAQELIADRSLSVQDGFPVVCFLDGELYSVTYLRERHDEAYFASHYGVNEEQVAIITGGELDAGKASDLTDYQEMIRFLSYEDMTDPENYAKAEELMDIQSFLDFMAANLYCNNLDIAMQHNFKMWRCTGDDTYGKWQMAIYDMDAVSWAYHVRTEYGLADCDPFRYAMKDPEKYGEDARLLIDIPAFRNLLSNGEFRQRFILTFLDLMNSCFSMDSLGGARYAPYTDLQPEVWEVLLGKERRGYAIAHLKNALDLDNAECTVTVEAIGGGRVTVNTAKAFSPDGVWQGTYLSGMALTFTAEADEGYVFAGWSGDVTGNDPSVVLPPGPDGLTVQARFVPKEGA